MTPNCRKCGTELNDDTWYPAHEKEHRHICKACNYERFRAWRKVNPDKAKAACMRQGKPGQISFSKNRKCPLYLGVHVAERVLSHAFKDVKRMPMGNHGFDFICNHGKKIDVKSSCLKKNGRGWVFNIFHNTTADFFLCLAFDNREDLNPLHAWLIPGSKINHLSGVSVSISTIHKWDKYQLDISKISDCCDIMK